jgi:hypothetical protein
MIKENDKTQTMTNDFIQKAEAQVKEWIDDFERLENEILDAGTDVGQTYREQIASLKRYLNDVEARLHDLQSSDPEQWTQNKNRFESASRTYHQAYGTALNEFKSATHVPAGWLEGFTDRPPTGSAGWLEGTGAHSTGSEGWVEGMAEKGPKSEGWTEGYKQTA